MEKKGSEWQSEKDRSRKDETEKGHYPPDFMAPRRRKQSKGTISPERRRTVTRCYIDH